MSARTLVIVNPRSRNGATGRRWGALEPRLRAELGAFESEFTRGPRDAERIAREGVRSGIERVLVAGGDGTLNEVVTGLLAAGLGGYVQIGVLPLGTGGDFARSAGMPARMDDAIAALKQAKPRAIDAGRICYRDRALNETTSYFVNIASFGISGLIDRFVNQTSKRFGGKASFLAGTLKALARYRATSVAVRVDGTLVHDGPLMIVAAANGCWFGGGMQIAPEARLDDGLLDVVLIPEHPKLKLISKLPLLYSGRHLGDPICSFLRGREIEAEAEPGTVLLDIDGEPLGSLPARIEIMPQALWLIGSGE
ncbi:MAG: diacylglycerol kinase family lipid kinase [Deltaproteobacteria bacterium]|nr:diacylglycerol kinase family lipid kinase [Deltaproteobacteria bacterium]